MLNLYVEKITALKERGQVEIDLTDVDLDFFLCDTLDRLEMKYDRLMPKRSRYKNDKVLIIRINKEEVV